jgi:hypothetical protein
MFILYNIVTVLANMSGSHFITHGKITYGSVVLKNHLTIILSLLCLFGSCFLLFKDRTGWALCVITSLIYGINLFLSSRSKAGNDKLPMAEYYKSYGIAALVFLTMFVLLILKPIRSRYSPTIRTWIIIAAAILLFIIDSLVF